MSIVEQAKQFAIKHHGDQRYGKGEDSLPYAYHLEKVFDVIWEFQDLFPGPSPTLSHLMAASFLHDILEDTPVTFEEIFSEFGRNIARLVFAVTNEPGKNRHERHERTYPKLRAAGREALALKLSDRIANVRHSVQHNHNILGMYKKEYKDFRAYLKIPGELKTMWAELDRLHNHFVENQNE